MSPLKKSSTVMLPIKWPSSSWQMSNFPQKMQNQLLKKITVIIKIVQINIGTKQTTRIMTMFKINLWWKSTREGDSIGSCFKGSWGALALQVIIIIIIVGIVIIIIIIIVGIVIISIVTVIVIILIIATITLFQFNASMMLSYSISNLSGQSWSW